VRTISVKFTSDIGQKDMRKLLRHMRKPISPDIYDVNSCRVMRPGGWMEFQEVHHKARYDDRTAPVD
jgi:hypothetical protein